MGRGVKHELELELAAQVRRARVYRWPEGNPVFYPSYPGRLAAFRGGGIEGDDPLPVTREHLAREGVSPAFVGYLSNFPGFVEPT